jgi:hypothetical protein
MVHMDPDDEAYAQHTPVTHPGPHAALLRAFPTDPVELVPVLQNVLVHHSRVEGFTAGTGRPDDGTELRPVRALLDRITALDDRPWSAPREPGRRLVVDCRSLAVLMVSVLRERTVPARARFGFAGYLAPTHWQSHVVCEHAAPDGGWTRTDPDVGRFGVGPGAFLDAAQAWHACENDGNDDRYGYRPELRGRWTVRWELTRDLAARTGFESLTSDVWGLVAELPDDDPAVAAATFDRVAAASGRGQWQALAAEPAFAVPPVITTAPYLTGAVYDVDLAAEGSLWARIP